MLLCNERLLSSQAFIPPFLTVNPHATDSQPASEQTRLQLLFHRYQPPPIHPPSMSVWNPDNIKDVAESVGIATLSDDVVENLARDVEYRIAQVLEEALKFMRHAKRTILTTQDVSNGLRVLDVEPLYGYESTRPLRFGEATIGPGQPLFYVEDEEVDFEKLINAPLPRVPREISFTGMFFLGLFVVG